MTADLLDDRFIEVTRVAKELSDDVIGVLQTTEGGYRKLGSQAPLHLHCFAIMMGALNPSMMLAGGGMGDVLLKYHDIRVWKDLGVHG